MKGDISRSDPIFMTLPEVEAICDEVGIINKGKLLVQDSVENLRRTTGIGMKLKIVLAQPDKRVVSALQKMSCIQDVKSVGQKLTIYTTFRDEVRPQIIDTIVKAGGDLVRIDDLTFTVDDPSVYYDEAREKATADAKARAEKLAEQTGVKLGEPTYIAESAYMSHYYEGITYGMAEMAIPAPAPVSTPISPGELKVSLTVQIAYSIR